MDRLESCNSEKVANEELTEKIIIQTDDDFAKALNELKKFLTIEEHRSDDSVRNLFISKYEAEPDKITILDMVGCMSAASINGAIKYGSKESVENLASEIVESTLGFAEFMISLTEQ